MDVLTAAASGSIWKYRKHTFLRAAAGDQFPYAAAGFEPGSVSTWWKTEGCYHLNR
jgi:hypothetical protein